MSMRCVVTFLGHVPSSRGGNYEATKYDFGSGSRRSHFFGTALAEESEADTIRVLGTTGSMWDVLLHELDETTIDTPEWSALAEAVRNDCVTAADLAAVEPLLARAGKRVYQLRLIPYGYDPAAQAAILQTLSEGFQAGDEILLDVTHGLRHLPMLGLLSALYLHALKRARVAEIYYAAFDRKRDGVTPVMRLGGLLTLYDWIRALERFDKDGDYGEFAGLLSREGQPGELLEQAAFLERIANSSLARQKLESFAQQLGALSTPAGELFRPELEARIDWRRKPERQQWEGALAREYLSRRDYVRATQFAYEALVTQKTVQMGGDINEYEAREEADAALSGASAGSPPEHPDNFRSLKNLRNALAHGLRSSDSRMGRFVRKLAEDRLSLHRWLDKCFRVLPK